MKLMQWVKLKFEYNLFLVPVNIIGRLPPDFVIIQNTILNLILTREDKKFKNQNIRTVTVISLTGLQEGASNSLVAMRMEWERDAYSQATQTQMSSDFGVNIG